MDRSLGSTKLYRRMATAAAFANLPWVEWIALGIGARSDGRFSRTCSSIGGRTILGHTRWRIEWGTLRDSEADVVTGVEVRAFGIDHWIE